MKKHFGLALVVGAAALMGCNEGDSPSGPDVNPKDNPFKGKWAYHRYVEFSNGGEDTVDLTESFKNIGVVFYDSTGRHNVPSRPNSALDSLKYYFTADSLYETGYVDNFLNYKGRPYVFKGSEKDTLDLSDPIHIEVLIRTK